MRYSGLLRITFQNNGDKWNEKRSHVFSSIPCFYKGSKSRSHWIAHGMFDNNLKNWILPWSFLMGTTRLWEVHWTYKRYPDVILTSKGYLIDVRTFWITNWSSYMVTIWCCKRSLSNNVSFVNVLIKYLLTWSIYL